MTNITFHGGVNDIGGNKFLEQNSINLQKTPVRIFKISIPAIFVSTSTFFAGINTGIRKFFYNIEIKFLTQALDKSY